MQYFIIDFDSTFVKSEGLEELAEVVLKHNPTKEVVLQNIKRITRLGMEGKISFSESLSKRLALLKGHRLHVEEVIRILKKKISRSIIRNKPFFKRFKKNIYIVSGGFKEYIDPIVTEFGIPKNHVFANRFIYDSKGNIAGCEKGNPLAMAGGKVQIVKDLGLNGEVFVIGDGYTDYQVKEMGAAKKFIAFTENIERELVIKKADHIAPNFDEFLYVNRLQRSLSYPKNRIRIFIAEAIDRKVTQSFIKEGYQLEGSDFRSVNILIADSKIKVTEELLSNCPRLMAIEVSPNRTDRGILLEAMKRGIAIFPTAKSIVLYVNTGNTMGSMNIPNISVSKTKNTHRLLHIHRNVPGMLAKINSIMAKHRMNILMQFLKTNKQIGYVVTDVNKKYDKQVLKDLKKIPHTIRFRVLY